MPRKKQKTLREKIIEAGFGDKDGKDHKGKWVFADKQMRFFAKNGFLLFYNEPLPGHEESFLMGYGEMRSGNYHCTSFRWAKSFDEIAKVYEAVINKNINEKCPS